MKNKIIFTIKETGHNLEYLHHIYEQCAIHPDCTYIFLVPEKIKSLLYNFKWSKCGNIRFDFISAKTQDYCLSHNKIANAFNISLLLRKKIKEHKAEEVFAITIMALMPFSGLLVPAKLSGIIYGIYLYNWKTMSLMGKIVSILKYKYLSLNHRYKDLFILNDESGALYLNRKYSTHKFVYLPDPFVKIDTRCAFDFRKENNIPNEAFVFLHFGAIERRKGTLSILSSIKHLPENLKNSCYFVFAGKIKNDIREEFYALVESTNNKKVLIFDEFCSYSSLASMCMACDAILMPYLEVDKSSGLLGYASQFSKPVIGSSTGMIGKLIRKYKLGVKCNPQDPIDLIRCYNEVIMKRITEPSNMYCNSHSLHHFKSVLEYNLKG